MDLIERLETSPNFATTHHTIEKLSEFDDFNEREVKLILNAYLSNNQIYFIIDDVDVADFVTKVITFAKTEDLIELGQKVKDLFPKNDD